MNKKERQKIEDLEKRCRKCPNYQEYRDKNYIRCGFCISFKAVYTHINDYNKCPYDDEKENEE